ncbi:hypothetical protein VVR12_07405 [Rothia sp. LK2588]|uniref:hypothetical protein n=1 Tax=Rothia sp. LK2588 TaxID=3114369 RepID=UPI0034CFE28A
MSSASVSIPRYRRPDEKPAASLGDYRGRIFAGLLAACCVGSVLRYPFTREFVVSRLDPEMVAEAGGSTDAMVTFGTVFGLVISSVCVLFVGLGIIHQLGRAAQNRPDLVSFANISIVATMLAMVVPQLLYVVLPLQHAGVIAAVIYSVVIAGAAWVARRTLSGLRWKVLLPLFLAIVLPLIFFGSLFIGVMS